MQSCNNSSKQLSLSKVSQILSAEAPSKTDRREACPTGHLSSLMHANYDSKYIALDSLSHDGWSLKKCQAMRFSPRGAWV